MSSIAELQAKLTEARNELGNVIVGQEGFRRTIYIHIDQGHALLIGVPGLAKTLIVHSLAKVLGGQFNRVQFTPI